MLSVANRTFMLSKVKLNAIMLSVIAPPIGCFCLSRLQEMSWGTDKIILLHGVLKIKTILVLNIKGLIYKVIY